MIARLIAWRRNAQRTALREELAHSLGMMSMYRDRAYAIRAKLATLEAGL